MLLFVLALQIYKHFSKQQTFQYFIYMEIPNINSRIKQIIDYYTNGVVSKFADTLPNISQQQLNRLFTIDTRTKKYPVATTEVLMSITEMYVDIDSCWLLTGNGNMFNTKTESSTNNSNVVYKPNNPQQSIASDFHAEYTPSGIGKNNYLSSLTNEEIEEMFADLYESQMLKDIEQGRYYPAVIVNNMLEDKEGRLRKAQQEIGELKSRLRAYEQSLNNPTVKSHKHK